MLVYLSKGKVTIKKIHKSIVCGYLHRCMHLTEFIKMMSTQEIYIYIYTSYIYISHMYVYMYISQRNILIFIIADCFSKFHYK